MSRPQCDLILSGGSTKGPVHAGALKVVSKSFDVTRIAGNSAGSIWGGMYACGHSPDHIEQVTLDTDFAKAADVMAGSTLSDVKEALRFLKKGWLSSGSKLRAKLRSKDFYGSKRLRDTVIPIWVAVSNATKDRLEFLSSEDRRTWNILVADAVAASACIPCAFRPVDLKGSIYYDGGLFADFPIDVFAGSQVPRRRTVGMLITGSPAKTDKRDMRLPDRLATLLALTIQGNVNRSVTLAPKNAIIARASGLGLGMLDFDVDRSTKEALIQEGSNAMKRALIDAGIIRRRAPRLRRRT